MLIKKKINVLEKIIQLQQQTFQDKYIIQIIIHWNKIPVKTFRKPKLYTLSLATLVFPLQLSISSQQYTPPFRLAPYPFQICKSSCSLLKKKKNEKHNRGNTLKISYNKRLSSYRRRAWINKRVSSLRSLGFRSERSGGRVVHAWT